MAGALRFEDLHVGDRWESPRRTVTESDIVNFACLTGDFDPLHVDHEFARQSPFGKPIAHGLLGLSWVAGLASHYPLVETAAFVSIQSWEFLKPIFVGDTLKVVNEVVELRRSGRRRGSVVWKRTLVNQSGAIVQQGAFETLVAVHQVGETLGPPALAEPPPETAPADVSVVVPEPPTPKPAAVKPAAATKPAATKATASKPTRAKSAVPKKTRRSTRNSKRVGP